MPTYDNTSRNSYPKNNTVLPGGAVGFVTQELFDGLDGVTRTADTPYAHEPLTIAADDTMTPWVWTPAGTHALYLRGDWVGQCTVQMATQAAGSDATMAGEFVNGIDAQVQVFDLPVACYMRFGFVAGDYVSGSLYSNVQVGD